MTTKTDGRTERRNENRQRVLDAGVACVNTGGGIDPEEVCKLAGVSYRSFFRYWQNVNRFKVDVARIVAPWLYESEHALAESAAACPDFVFRCILDDTLYLLKGVTSS